MNNIIEISNIYYNKALELVNNGKISQAVEFIEKSLNYYGNDIQALNLMGICDYMLCSFDKAYFYWSKSVTCNAENNRASYYFNILSGEEFRTLMEKYNSAIDEIHNGKYKNAISILEKINDSNMELIEPYAMLGLCFCELKEYDLAKKYIQQALNMDKDNVKYLTYLNEINSENIPRHKGNKLKGNLIASIIALLLIVTSALYFKNINKYNQLSIKSLENEKKIQDVTSAFESSKSDNDKLKTQLESEKQKNEELTSEIKSKSEEVNNNNYTSSEPEIFTAAILNFKKQEYIKAIDKFDYIANKGIQKNLAAESTYYLAVCYEKQGNYNMAENYYSIYISKFKGKNYYDDSLYNYGLLLYKQGDKDKSKEVLNKLQQKVPNSMFVNSKVKYILNN